MKSSLPITAFIFLITFLTVGYAAAQRPDPNFRSYLTEVRFTVVRAFAMQPDGKVLVGGTFNSANGYYRNTIARFHPDGTLDEGFTSPNGVGSIFSIAVQDDGKIVLAGNFEVVINGTIRRGIVRVLSDGTLDPILSDGTLDPTFTNATGTPAGLLCLAVQPDGKLLVGGAFSTFNGLPRFNLVRLNVDGSLDDSFMGSLAGEARHILMLPNGQMMIGGNFSSPGVMRRHIIRLNADGTADPTFTFASDYEVNSMKMQPDGKLLLARNNAPATGMVIRLNADGSLDSGFSCGILSNQDRNVQWIDLQPDGRLIVGGIFGPSSDHRSVYRLNSDGSVDMSFEPFYAGLVYTVLVQPTGKILVGGFASTIGAERNHFHRLNSDGSSDETFPASVGNSSTGYAVGFSPEGKVYVGGPFIWVNGKERKYFARLNRDGSLDQTFMLGSVNGIVRDLVVQPDGKVVIAGDFDTINGVLTSRIARLNSDGTFDDTFQVGTGFNSDLNDIVLQADGKIIAGGLFSSFNGVARIRIARLNSDGSLDATFNSGSPGPANGVNIIVPLPDGKILIGGSFNQMSGAQVGKIARLNSNGTWDSTFNAGGVGFSPFDLSHPVHGLAVQSDGKIVVGGDFSAYNGVPRAGLARLNPDGSLDTSFSLPTQIVVDIRTQADGKILLGGQFTSVGGIARRHLARLNVDGTVDTDFDIEAGPIAGEFVAAIAVSPAGNVALGGSFRTIGAQAHQGVAILTRRSGPFDFDGDGKTDIGIFRPNVGEWWINRSSNGQTFALQFGSSTDRIVPADYTGDGKADIAFFRPSSGQWFVLRSEDFSFFALPFGTSGDIPAPADYDADGKADFTVFRPSSGTWFVSHSNGSPTEIVQFGVNGDQPVVADYDNDGKADIGIFRNNNGVAEWWINRSTAGLLAMQFGAGTDKPVQGDYTGDGKADIAIFRPATGEWLIVRSEDFSFFGFPFGATGDIVAPGDYDGDGKFDATVFRPSNGTWFIARSTAGTQIVQFGVIGDRPVSNAFLP